jgi:hypothetical protein
MSGLYSFLHLPRWDMPHGVLQAEIFALICCIPLKLSLKSIWLVPARLASMTGRYCSRFACCLASILLHSLSRLHLRCECTHMVHYLWDFIQHPESGWRTAPHALKRRVLALKRNWRYGHFHGMSLCRQVKWTGECKTLADVLTDTHRMDFNALFDIVSHSLVVPFSFPPISGFATLTLPLLDLLLTFSSSLIPLSNPTFRPQSMVTPAYAFPPQAERYNQSSRT